MYFKTYCSELKGHYPFKPQAEGHLGLLILKIFLIKKYPNDRMCLIHNSDISWQSFFCLRTISLGRHTRIGKYMV